MTKLKELHKSPHIHVALATGVSIVILAFFSKSVLAEPISSLQLALPPLLITFHGYILTRHKKSPICKTWYWIAAIFIATALIIVLHAVKVG